MAGLRYLLAEKFCSLWHLDPFPGGDCEIGDCTGAFAPVANNVSMEVEDIVGIRHQATTGEDTAD
jgi:hypothetical protein